MIANEPTLATTTPLVCRNPHVLCPMGTCERCDDLHELRRYTGGTVTRAELLSGDFLRGYLECALWTGCCEEGEPLDSNYDISDFSDESIRTAATDCQTFRAANEADLEAFYEEWPYSPDGSSKESFAGHNLWLTRNDSGTGFWDRDAGDAGDRLTEAAQGMGGSDAYVGDDGQLWLT